MDLDWEIKVFSRRLLLVFPVRMEVFSAQNDFDGECNVAFDNCPRWQNGWSSCWKSITQRCFSFWYRSRSDLSQTEYFKISIYAFFYSILFNFAEVRFELEKLRAKFWTENVPIWPFTSKFSVECHLFHSTNTLVQHFSCFAVVLLLFTRLLWWLQALHNRQIDILTCM